MLERSLPLALAIACPLFAAAPSLAMSLRLDHDAFLSSSARAATPIALATAQRQDALDLMARTSRFVHPSATQLEAWREIYSAPLGDFGDRVTREPLVEPDVVETSVGDGAPNMDTPPGPDPVPAVPEPAAAIVFGLGGLVVGASLLRVRRRADAAPQA